MGGEDDYAPAAVTLPLKTPSPFSSSIRFFGLLKQPESDNGTTQGLELDERDVIWAPDLKSDPFDPDSDQEPESEPDLISSPVTPYPFYPNTKPNPGGGGGFGLSALFADADADADRGLTVRRSTRPISGRIGPGPDLMMAKSAPVNVPTWHRRRAPPPPPRFDDALDEEDDDVDGDEDVEMVPPHVIVARSHVTTFSVFEGVGRTLKGRDLRRVRNAVFQQTGFLD